MKTPDDEDLKAFIQDLGAIDSDHMLAPALAKRCADYDGSTPPDQFLHELRDWIVFTCGAAEVVILAINVMIGPGRKYPPPCALKDA